MKTNYTENTGIRGYTLSQRLFVGNFGQSYLRDYSRTLWGWNREVRNLPTRAPRGFSLGSQVFPPLLKTSISKFQFDRMHDLPENHFRVTRASLVNSTYYLL